VTATLLFVQKFNELVAVPVFLKDVF